MRPWAAPTSLLAAFCVFPPPIYQSRQRSWRPFLFRIANCGFWIGTELRMLDVGIVGASGYGGGELLRWMSVHPNARVAVATSRTYAGQPVSASFPGLAGRVDLRFAGDSDSAAVQ